MAGVGPSLLKDGMRLFSWLHHLWKVDLTVFHGLLPWWRHHHPTSGFFFHEFDQVCHHVVFLLLVLYVLVDRRYLRER